MSARGFLAGLCLLAAVSGVWADPSPAPPPVPASLAVPADQTLVLTLTARGYQIYEWRPVADQPGRFEWAFKEPDADLFDAQGRKVGHHSAGPTWALTDGSKVVGKVKAKADAPDGKGVPWLLLDAVQTSGGGVMSQVKSIRRINTVGGMASGIPAGPGTPAAGVGQQEQVGYTATYEVYVATP